MDAGASLLHVFMKDDRKSDWLVESEHLKGGFNDHRLACVVVPNTVFTRRWPLLCVDEQASKKPKLTDAVELQDQVVSKRGE